VLVEADGVDDPPAPGTVLWQAASATTSAMSATLGMALR